MTTRKQVRDQIIGKTQAAGLSPTTVGIARNRVIAKALQRTLAAADAIAAIVKARDSADDEAKRLARLLIENPEFRKAMSATLTSIQEELKQAAGAGATQPKQPSANDDPDPASPEGMHGGADYPESPSPNHEDDPKKGSGLPGADGASTERPGSYSKAHLIRDLATQNGAAARLALTMGTDAANARVASDPLVPAWDSPVWSAEARDYFRTRAVTSDGWALSHMGNVPQIDQYFR